LASLLVEAQHGLPPCGEHGEVFICARKKRGRGEVWRERDAAGGDKGLEQVTAVAECEAGELGGGEWRLSGGVGLEEEDVGVGVQGGDDAGEERGGVVAVEEEDGGAAVGVGEELEDRGPAEAVGEDLRDAADGDEGEEAREGDDEVAELGVLVGPEAEQRGGGVEEAAHGEGGPSRGGAPGEELRLRGEEAAALREPGLVGAAGGESVVEVARGGGEGEEVAGAQVGGDQGEDVLRQGEDQIGAVAGELGGGHRDRKEGRGGEGSVWWGDCARSLACLSFFFLSPVY
jgi:hypothetical protein